MEENTHCERNAVYVIEEGSEDAYVRVQERGREREKKKYRKREGESEEHPLIDRSHERSKFVRDVTRWGGGSCCRLLFGGFQTNKQLIKLIKY